MDHMQKILRLIPSVDDCLLALLQDPEFETIPSMLLKKASEMSLTVNGERYWRAMTSRRKT